MELLKGKYIKRYTKDIIQIYTDDNLNIGKYLMLLEYIDNINNYKSLFYDIDIVEVEELEENIYNVKYLNKVNLNKFEYNILKNKIK